MKDAEQSVIGGLMLDNSKWPAVSNVLSANDFEDSAHKFLFESIAELASKSIGFDPITLSDNLNKVNKLDAVGGGAYLGLLAGNTPSAANVVIYAHIVRRGSLERQLKLAYDKHAPSGEIARFELALKQVESGKYDLFGEISQTFNTVAKMKFDQIKWIVEDILPAGVSMLAAKPKKGKSWLALELSMAVASGDIVLGCKKTIKGDVLYFALEDSDRRMNDRFIKTLIDDSFEDAPPNAHLVSANALNVIPRLGEGFEEKLDIYLSARPETNLVVVDPFTFIETPGKRGMRGYLEDYQVISKLTNLTRTKYPNLAILLVYHMRKENSQEVVDTVMGTTGIAGAVDNLLLLKRENRSSEAKLFLTGKDVEEAEYAMRFDKLTFSWKMLDVIDVFGDFIEDCCILADDARVKTGELYARYEIWCDDNGENALSNVQFGRQIKEHGINKIKNHGVAFYLGLKIGDQRDQRDQQISINTSMENPHKNQTEFSGPSGPSGPHEPQPTDNKVVYEKSGDHLHVPTDPDKPVPNYDTTQVSKELMTRLINSYDGETLKSISYLQRFFSEDEIDELVMVGLLEVGENDDLQLTV